MPKIEDTMRYNIKWRILSEAGTWLLLFDSAYTTYKEATARVKLLQSEGCTAKYVYDRVHCVYSRAPGKGRRY